MTKKQISVIAFLIFAAFFGGAILQAILEKTAEKREVTPPVALFSQQEPGGCSQCLGKNCYSAPCNMECRLVGDGCETIVMGGGAAPYSPETKAADGDYAMFYLQRVIKNNEAMRVAGIEIGDTIERVNGDYAGSDLEFAKQVLTLPKGTVLRVWKRNGAGTADITL